MSTKYIVTRENADATLTEVATKAKKSDAIAIADQERADSRRTVRVHTDKGTLVHEVKGVRPMKSTPRFSRTVELPEGFEIPEGARPAYLRLKHDAVIVAFDGEEDKTKRYGVVRVSTGKLQKQRFAKTRDAGKFVLTLESPKARAKRLEAEKAAQAQGGEQPEPEATPAPESELANA